MLLSPYLSLPLFSLLTLAPFFVLSVEYSFYFLLSSFTIYLCLSPLLVLFFSFSSRFSCCIYNCLIFVSYSNSNNCSNSNKLVFRNIIVLLTSIDFNWKFCNIVINVENVNCRLLSVIFVEKKKINKLKIKKFY